MKLATIGQMSPIAVLLLILILPVWAAAQGGATPTPADPLPAVLITSADTPAWDISEGVNYCTYLSINDAYQFFIAYEPPNGGFGTDDVAPLEGDWSWDTYALNPGNGGAWPAPVGNPMMTAGKIWTTPAYVWYGVQYNTGSG